jgi:hypothetical protein
VFSGVACTMLLLLGVVALNASQPPPPTVAEFAPAALDQITDSPDRQQSDVGSEPGGETSGGPSASSAPSLSATPSPSPSAQTEKPKVLDNCVGTPPRQIDDPQSPPCVNVWEGDNGGATSFGVTADEIRVSFPYGTAFTPNAVAEAEALVSFFNQNFMFYGRKIRLMPFVANGDNFQHPVPANMIGDATAVVSEDESFASLGYPDRKGAEHIYYDELARNKVISVVGRETALGTEAYYAKRHPYQWNRGVAIDTMLRHYGQHVCNSWAKRKPRFGGPWAFPAQPTVRKIAVLVNEADGGVRPDVKPLLDNLKVCDETPIVQYAPVPKQQGDGINPMLQMADAEVTTIICVCTVDGSREYLNAAEAQGYHPEWLMGTFSNNDLDNSFATSSVSQTNNVFGISHSDKFLPVRDTWWYKAMRDGNPKTPPPDKGGPIATYQNLLLLASGIQAAGPNLTPETFAAGLHRTVFPNPGAGKAPFYQSRVGFSNGQHSMRNDASMYWYDLTKTGNNDPTAPGRICHVRKGLRYGTGQWPKEDPPYKVEADCT